MGYLFPAENTESDKVDDDHPQTDEAKLRQDVNEMFALCRNQADAVDDRRERQER